MAHTVTWSILELDLGILAASMATLRPLFKNCRIPGFSSGRNHKYNLSLSNIDPLSNLSTLALSKNHSEGEGAGDNNMFARELVIRSEDGVSQESIISHDVMLRRVEIC